LRDFGSEVIRGFDCCFRLLFELADYLRQNSQPHNLPRLNILIPLNRTKLGGWRHCAQFLTQVQNS
jgi:hypothetical protein